MMETTDPVQAEEIIRHRLAKAADFISHDVTHPGATPIGSPVELMERLRNAIAEAREAKLPDGEIQKVIALAFLNPRLPGYDVAKLSVSHDLQLVKRASTT